MACWALLSQLTHCPPQVGARCNQMADPYWSEGLGKLHEHWGEQPESLQSGAGGRPAGCMGWGLAPAIGFPELTQDHPHHLTLPWPYLGTDVRDPPDRPFAQGASASQTASLGPPLGNAGPDQPLLPRSSILCPRPALGPGLTLSRGSLQREPCGPSPAQDHAHSSSHCPQAPFCLTPPNCWKLSPTL